MIPRDADPDGKHYTWTIKKGRNGFMSKRPSASQVSGHEFTRRVCDQSNRQRRHSQVRTPPGPFGVIIWEKKKTELTVDERRVFYAQTAKTEQNG
jgi:hypothetical protein